MAQKYLFLNWTCGFIRTINDWIFFKNLLISVASYPGQAAKYVLTPYDCKGEITQKKKEKNFLKCYISV